MKVNNITRLLESRKIPFQTFELPDEKRGAIEAAELIGAPPEQVFKTIVVTRKGRGKPVLAVVPGPNEVDLKMLANTLEEKKVLLPTQREAERLTGLKAGGISPLALLNRGFQVVLDKKAQEFEEIYISGGERGLNICLPVNDFIELTEALLSSISRGCAKG